MPGTKKTDNDLLEAKVALRIRNLPPGPIRVLDAYGGHGVVWSEIIRRTKRSDIVRVAIDKERRPGALRGNNMKYLRSLDLRQFQVIDLDAYGVPFDQTEIVLRRGFRGVVFFTFIQSVMGMIPAKLSESQGISRAMLGTCPTLFAGLGWELWKDWLAQRGVKRLTWVESGGSTDKARKHYGVFVLPTL